MRAAVITRRASSTAAAAAAAAAAPPVLIIGGGPVGLFASLLLSRYGVPSVLVERHERGGDAALERHEHGGGGGARPHPRAHVLNARTMELLRALGLDSAVAGKAPPFEQWRHWRYCESVLGRDLGVVDFFDDVDGCARNLEAHSPDGEAVSRPGRVLHVAQPHIEDVLQREAFRWRDGGDCGAGDAQFLYRHEVAGMEENERGVRVKLRALDGKSSDRTVHCAHVIAADGVNSVARSACGITSSGDDGLEHFLSFHFTCRGLAPQLRERPAMLYFVFNPDVIAVLVAHDIDAGDWVAHVPFFPPLQRAEDFDDAHFRKVLSAAVGTDVGDGRSGSALDFELHSMRPWTMRSEVADDFSSSTSSAADESASGDGRIHLLGDAAHQFPPSGGFGVNTGLHDAHNVAWKIAAVERCGADRSLLRSYSEERRPIALDTAALSVRNYQRGLKPASALGLERGQLSVLTGALASAPLEAMVPLWLRRTALDAAMHAGRSAHLGISAAPFGGGRIEALRRVVEGREALPLLFPRHDLGYEYRASSAIARSSDGGAAAARDLGDDAHYVPSTRPGARFPHVDIVATTDDSANAKEESMMRSTLDLIAIDGVPRLLAVADGTSAEGREFARAFASYAHAGGGSDGGVPIDVALIEDVGRGGAAAESRWGLELQSEFGSELGTGAGAVSVFGVEDAAAAVLFEGGAAAILVRPDGYVSWRHDASSSVASIKGGVDSVVAAVVSRSLGSYKEEQ